ncbi:MAG: aldo/keto reductase [Aggregatilineales bacterium]
MGLGLAALGRPGYITLTHNEDISDYDVAEMETHAHAVLDSAWHAGIRYFDAARSYGKAEQFLGSWLRSREIDRSEVIIGSKWGYTYTADWQVKAETHEVKEHSLSVLQRQWAETLSFLGYTPNLYQIHSATLDSGVLDNRAVLNELGKLKAGGTLIGLTLSGANQSQTLEKALGVMMDGVRLFDSVQVTWNLLERSTTAILREARRLGLAVIVKEAVANGRLTSSNHEQDFQSQMQLLKTEATRLGTTIDALALAAVLAQEWATIVLSGAANSQHLEANVKAFDVRWDEIAENALASLEEMPEAYWAERSQLSWN